MMKRLIAVSFVLLLGACGAETMDVPTDSVESAKKPPPPPPPPSCTVSTWDCSSAPASAGYTLSGSTFCRGVDPVSNNSIVWCRWTCTNVFLCGWAPTTTTTVVIDPTAGWCTACVGDSSPNTCGTFTSPAQSYTCNPSY